MIRIRNNIQVFSAPSIVDSTEFSSILRANKIDNDSDSGSEDHNHGDGKKKA